MRRTGDWNFTLLELLAVMAVIAGLAAMMLPVLGGSRHRARAMGCLSLMRGYCQATSLYADDFGDYFPDIRTYLEPEAGFGVYLHGHGDPPESLTRCPGDSATAILGRLGEWHGASGIIRVSIGGTSNLTDSQSRTSAGPARINQARFMPQNRNPSRRCLWTDYQNRSEERRISGASLSVWRGTSPSDSLKEYVFRHPGNAANGAFADGHAGRIRLAPGIATVNGGHDLAPGSVWILPGNMTYPYGPRQISGPGGGGSVDALEDAESVCYREENR